MELDELASTSQTDFSILKDLTQKSIHKNKAHQHALSAYAEQLNAELQELDSLVNSVSVADDDGISRPDIHIPGAKRPTSLISSHDFLNPDSPFYEEASQRSRYLSETTDHTMKPKDVENLAEAIKNENKRLQALSSQRGLPSNTIDIDRNVEGINWETICEKVTSDTKSEYKRTPEQYRIKWVGDKHPDINHGSWENSELDMLRGLVEEYTDSKQKFDWVDIARRLGTHRTPIDCMRNAGLRNRNIVWTSELEQRLTNAVEKYGTNNWNVVARVVSDDVTAGQCQGRYQRNLDPAVKRGFWGVEEAARLKEAVDAWGNSWVDVATCMPGRTNETCRERWTEYLSASSATAEWTAEDDQNLFKAVEELGNQWKLISMRIGNGSSGTKCKNRYQKLKRLQELYKKASMRPGLPAPSPSTSTALQSPSPAPSPTLPQPSPAPSSAPSPATTESTSSATPAGPSRAANSTISHWHPIQPLGAPVVPAYLESMPPGASPYCAGYWTQTPILPNATSEGEALNSRAPERREVPAARSQADRPQAINPPPQQLQEKPESRIERTSTAGSTNVVQPVPPVPPAPLPAPRSRTIRPRPRPRPITTVTTKGVPPVTQPPKDADQTTQESVHPIAKAPVQEVPPAAEPVEHVDQTNQLAEVVVEPIKRKRGRPRKSESAATPAKKAKVDKAPPVKASPVRALPVRRSPRKTRKTGKLSALAPSVEPEQVTPEPSTSKDAENQASTEPATGDAEETAASLQDAALRDVWTRSIEGTKELRARCSQPGGRRIGGA